MNVREHMARSHISPSQCAASPSESASSTNRELYFQLLQHHFDLGRISQEHLDGFLAVGMYEHAGKAYERDGNFDSVEKVYILDAKTKKVILKNIKS